MKHQDKPIIKSEKFWIILFLVIICLLLYTKYLAAQPVKEQTLSSPIGLTVTCTFTPEEYQRLTGDIVKYARASFSYGYFRGTEDTTNLQPSLRLKENFEEVDLSRRGSLRQMTTQQDKIFSSFHAHCK